MAESFFATLECECIEHEGPFRTQAEARMAVFRFIEGWYNPHRRHSRLGYLSPLAYERAVIGAEQPDLGVLKVRVEARSSLLGDSVRSISEPTRSDRTPVRPES